MYIVKAECNECFYLNHDKHNRYECIDEPGCVGKRIWQADRDINIARKKAFNEALESVANTMAMAMSLSSDEERICSCIQDCYTAECSIFWKYILGTEERYRDLNRLVLMLHRKTEKIINEKDLLRGQQERVSNNEDI